MVDDNQSAGSGHENLTDDAEYALSELVVNGPGDQYSVSLDQEVIRVGRGKGCDIVLDDPDLQLVHCEIWKQKGHYVLVDKGGEGGTSVNGRNEEFRVLKPGDRIQVGEASLTAVHQQEEEEPEPIDPEEATEFFDEGPPPDDPSDAPGKRTTGHKAASARRSRAQSGPGAWIVIGFVLLLLAAGTGYAYYQYTYSKKARELLQRARVLKQEQQYTKALSLLSDRLLKEYPDSNVVSSARDLRRNINTILNQRKHVRARFRALKSSVPPSDSLSADVKRERMKETLDRIDALLNRNKQFLQQYFGPKSESGNGPTLVDRIRELKMTASSYREKLSQKTPE